ncbi:MAG: 2Fe-2S iron-sulfur cluster-binding protein [Alphaproteobacteria bacterium]
MSNRLADGGLIDRGRRLRFRFDGRGYEGFQGDTLASALLANGARLVGRSFKYHRPRGVFAAGVEEPNALVTLLGQGRREPNARATTTELYDGLVAESQNRWPALSVDLMAVNGLLAPLLPAGFYYKTLFGGPGWRFFEPWVRRAAGLGKGSTAPDLDRYDHKYAHCEVLVVGAGPAGLAAALQAADGGERVMLVEQEPRVGGSLLWDRRTLDGRDGPAWAEAQAQALAAMDNVTLLRRTSAFGYYDDNLVALVERRTDHLAAAPAFTTRQRVWWVRAKRVVLATGAIEQPLLFPDNDRPGVMLAGAARAYLNRWAVKLGSRAVVYTNNDTAYACALDLAAAGIEVAALVDLRPAPDGPWPARLAEAGIALLAGHRLVGCRGGQSVHGVEAAPVNGGAAKPLGCDLVAVSGGWAPAVHLHAQAGGRLGYDEALGAYRPGPVRQAHESVGAATGMFELGQITGATVDDGDASPVGPGVEPAPGKVFVDLADDVTAADVELAQREGYRSVEHLKRYTTLGMGADQGKTSNLAGQSLSAKARAESNAAVGYPSFRPPYAPVTIGALAGADVGLRFVPQRRTALDDWHRRHGAIFVDAGHWRRPRAYLRNGETLEDAYVREAAHVRQSVGIADISTLGKIDIQGPDSLELLQRVYVNDFASLKVGRARYGLMLREDGLAGDDGTTARLGEHHYLMTTTTGHAEHTLSRLEYHLAVDWPELRCVVTSVTEQWAAIAVAGPSSRDLLREVLDGVDLDDVPFLAVADVTLDGVACRLFRISYSGELAYELHLPAGFAEAAWTRLLSAGDGLGVAPYGMEAMGALRIEKGHVTHAEMNGQTGAADLGLGRMAKAAKPHVGRAMSQRPALTDAERPALIGLVPTDGTTDFKGGMHLLREADVTPAPSLPVDSLGHVTSWSYSPALGMPIALALLNGGLAANDGATVYAHDPMGGRVVRARVVSPHFYDPKGERQRG